MKFQFTSRSISQLATEFSFPSKGNAPTSVTAIQSELKVKAFKEEVVEAFRREGLFEHVEGAVNVTSRFADNLEICAEWARAADDLVSKLKTTLSFGDNADLGQLILSRLEAAAFALFAMIDSSSLQGALYVLGLYAKTWMGSRTVTGALFSKASELLHKVFERKNSEDTFKEEGWLSDHMDLITEGELGVHLAEFVNLMIIVGIVPEESENLLGKEAYALLKVPQRRSQCGSVIKLFVNTCEWVFTCVVPALKTGNYALLLTNEEIFQMDKMYMDVSDMATMFANCEFQRLKEKHKISHDAEIVMRIDECIAVHEVVMRTTSKSSPLYRTCMSRVMRLDKISSDLQCQWKAAPLRQQPFAQLIIGGSSVAKSLLVSLANHYVSRLNEFPEGKEFFACLNGMDEYQSEFHSGILSVFLDDICNTRAEREKNNPLFILIQFCNNMHCAALSPLAEKKGKNDIRVKQVYATTNNEDLSAWFWTVNVVSIFRRFNLRVEVELNPDYITPEGDIMEGVEVCRCPDLWLITVSEHKIVRMGRTKDQLKLVKILDKGHLIDYFDILKEKTPKWFKKQDAIVSNSIDYHTAEHCKIHPDMLCDEHTPCLRCERDRDFLPISSEQSAAFISEPFERQGLGTLECDEETPMVDPELEGCENMFGIERTLYIVSLPFEGLDKKIARVRDDLMEHKDKIIVACLIIGSGFALYRAFGSAVSPEGALDAIKQDMRAPRQMTEKTNQWKKVYTNMKDYPKAAETSIPEAVERKIEKNQSVALIYEIDPVSRQELSGTRRCNIIPYRNAQWILPAQEIPAGRTYLIKVRTTSPDVFGVKFFEAIVDDSVVNRNIQANIAMVKMHRGGDVADFSKFVPQTAMEADQEFGRLYYRHVHSVDPGSEYYEVIDNAKTLRLEMTTQNVGGDVYAGYRYETDTHKGMCGASLWLANRNMTLIGMHIGGGRVGLTHRGFAVILSKEILEPLCHDGIGVTETTGFTPQAQCREIPVKDTVHPKNPLNFVEEGEDHTVEILGFHDMPQSKFRSGVKDSIIREKVEELFGKCDFTKPPKACANPARRNDLLQVSKDNPPPVSHYVEEAKRDFKFKIDRFLDVNREFLEYCHQLELNVAVNGQPGEAGFDCINPKTSMSFGWNCPKWKLFVRNVLAEAMGIDSRKIMRKNENGEFVYEFIFDTDKFDLEQSVDGLAITMWEGKRVNVVFCTNLKDEPIKWEKIAQNKIRVFSGAQFDFCVLTRIVTLPTITAMTNFPEVFESAVGVNAHGKDWDYIYCIAKKFGSKRCFAGDFSKYDKNMRGEFILGAFEILRHLLIRAGASELTLKLLDGIATECAFPIYDVQGAILKVFGSGPSGHALTVVINGLANCLYMRYAYYALHHERLAPEVFSAGDGTIPLFHEVVSLITYGDDNICSVSERDSVFNQVTVSRVLGTIGMPYTDAKKSAVMSKFQTVDELDFLKRNFTEVEGFSGRVGPLDFNSIMKSLCCTSSKDNAKSEAELVAQCIDSARQEIAFYGETSLVEFDVTLKPILDTKDADGFRVGDFTRKFDFADCVERYNNTVCTFGVLPLPEDQTVFERQGTNLSKDIPMNSIRALTGYRYWQFTYELGLRVADRSRNPLELDDHIGRISVHALRARREALGLVPWSDRVIFDTEQATYRDVAHLTHRWLKERLAFPAQARFQFDLALALTKRFVSNWVLLDEWMGPLFEDDANRRRSIIGLPVIDGPITVRYEEFGFLRTLIPTWAPWNQLREELSVVSSMFESRKHIASVLARSCRFFTQAILPSKEVALAMTNGERKLFVNYTKKQAMQLPFDDLVRERIASYLHGDTMHVSFYESQQNAYDLLPQVVRRMSDRIFMSPIMILMKMHIPDNSEYVHTEDFWKCCVALYKGLSLLVRPMITSEELSVRDQIWRGYFDFLIRGSFEGIVLYLEIAGRTRIFDLKPDVTFFLTY